MRLPLITLILLLTTSDVHGFLLPQQQPTTSSSSLCMFRQQQQKKNRRVTLGATRPAQKQQQQDEETDVNTSSSSSKTTSPPLQQQEPDMKAYAAGYKTVFEELPFKSCSPSSGTKIPDDLRGTYFRAGPAMFSAGSIVPPKKTSIVQPKQPPVPDGHDPDRMVRHPFEGDGAVLAVTFCSSSGDSDDGDDDQSQQQQKQQQAVTARFRYVRTAGFTNERKKGQRLYRAMDSTRELGPATAGGLGNDLPLPLFRHHLQPGLNKNRKNTSNTRAVYWGKRLLSLWDGGQPYKLDALALSTEGRSQLGGAIFRDTDPFGCKMVYDPTLNRAIFYAVDNSAAKQSELTLFEFNSDFRLVKEGGRFSVDLPGFALLHDFGATENYAVFVQPNVVVNNVQFLLSKEPGKVLNVVENNNDDDDGSPSSATVILVPRVGNSQKEKGMVSFSIPSDDLSEANLQFVNAYEDGDTNTVVVDAIRSAIISSSSSKGESSSSSSSASTWPWGTSLEEYRANASKKSLWRYTIDLTTGSVSKRLLLDDHCFFGVVNPAFSTQRHRFIYMNVGGLGTEVAPPQGIAKFDVESGQSDVWTPESYEFCGEPMYAPRTTTTTKKNDAATAAVAEDSGYIISVLFNGKTEESEIVILEASNISAGPITRIPLGIAVPHGLFGCFTTAEEAKWSPETIERRAKLADKMESRGNMWNEVKSDFSGLGLRFDDMEEYFGDFFS